MDASTITIIVVAVIFLGSIISAIFFDAPKPYRLRSCQGWNWHRSFPNVPVKEIRWFLSLFTGAFGFRDKEKLKFNPNDKLLDIYCAIYPIKGMPDALEFETLERDLKRKYGIDLRGVWNEELTLTLGPLFSHARNKGAQKV
ncbi:MAG: hypothetical protein LBI35_07085 [Burkholderiales bacterium]|jgi:hypothetical protein|nr:hypothetical protein [Burkholderiales bacterium]